MLVALSEKACGKSPVFIVGLEDVVCQPAHEKLQYFKRQARLSVVKVFLERYDLVGE